jgi:hypothetical protein
MKKLTALRCVPIACAALLQGCFGGGGNDDNDDTPSSQALTNPGSYEVCSYEDGLDDDRYASAIITYPCDLRDGPYPATTLTGGFTNTKEQMTWLSEFVTTHGYIVITMTPTNTLLNPPIWANAQHGGFDMLSIENQRIDSPVYNRVDVNNRNLMGFSMGGGGVLLAASEMGGAGNAPTSAIALASWLGKDNPEYADISSPTLILGSESDTIAVNSEKYYPLLPQDIERGIAMFSIAGHTDWMNDGDEDLQKRFRTLVTAFLEIQLKDDTTAYSYFDGAEHDEHVVDGWFSAFDYQK